MAETTIVASSSPLQDPVILGTAISVFIIITLFLLMFFNNRSSRSRSSTTKTQDNILAGTVCAVLLLFGATVITARFFATDYTVPQVEVSGISITQFSYDFSEVTFPATTASVRESEELGYLVSKHPDVIAPNNEVTLYCVFTSFENTPSPLPALVGVEHVETVCSPTQWKFSSADAIIPPSQVSHLLSPTSN